MYRNKVIWQPDGHVAAGGRRHWDVLDLVPRHAEHARCSDVDIQAIGAGGMDDVVSDDYVRPVAAPFDLKGLAPAAAPGCADAVLRQEDVALDDLNAGVGFDIVLKEHRLAVVEVHLRRSEALDILLQNVVRGKHLSSVGYVEEAIEGALGKQAACM
eukprot:CAMPEP_0196661726 /NCGR_PEP_ID=MMETSP1086-20130531/45663_1 /TAXON_ID=77921 /ORGANISM="Cyanoptyche  gloeocystis , Strain SAG4.97" /LENGTH=156 /DNA_ID=CAMNT_0041996755 /DNA_START=540 /DNA_END=1010 /DNA_ORIENTATION=-